MRAASTANTLDRATRFALRLYPDTWQERYADEVIDTLLELRRRRPHERRELLHLATRGLWLRARTSAAFWGGLLILGVMLWAPLGSGGTVFLAERYWPALLSLPTQAAIFVLPLTAAAVALQAHAHRRKIADAEGGSKRLGAAALAAAPVLATLIFGYLLVLTLALATSGLPTAFAADALLVPLSFFALALGALSVGLVFGILMPPAIGAPLVAVLLYAWYRMPESVGGSVLAWRDVTGSGITQCCLWLDVVPDPRAQLIAIVGGAAVTWIAAALMALQPGWKRAGASTLAALVVVLGLTAAAPLVPQLGQRSVAQRPIAELQCEGTEPQICLWPEQQSEYRTGIREVITDAYRRGLAAGLPMRATVTPYVNGLGEGQKAGSPINEVPMQLGDSDAEILKNYGQAVYASEACPAAGDATSSAELYRDTGVRYAIALLLGSEEAGALPVMDHSATEGLASTRYTPDEVRDLIGVHNTTEARATVDRWLASCGI
jgi:hypothetical protein